MDTEFPGSLSLPSHCADRTLKHTESPGVVLLARALGLDPMLRASVLLRFLEQHGGCLRTGVAALLAGDAELPGVGPAGLARLQASFSLATALAWETLRSAPALNSPAACEDFLRRHLVSRRREVFCCVFLDARNRVLAVRDMFIGTIDGAAVYPREVVAEALRHGACGVILAHNHPSGSIQPSAADIRLTERMRQALALVDVRLLDHFIIGHGAVRSMAVHGDAGFYG